MKSIDNLIPFFAAGAAALAASGCSQDPEHQKTPNVVFILADDLGWGDLSCYGQQLFSTPNIDALARDGIRFTQCYSGTTVSAPSRSCLITGTHSGHTAIRGNKPAKSDLIPEGQYPLPAGTQTIFHDFKAAGYRTGAFGKWGLGFIGTCGDPAEQGVDDFFGYNCQTLAHNYYPDHLWDNDSKVILEDSYSADLIHAEALEFLRASVEERKPFFMWYPTTIPHAELIVPEDSIITRLRGQYPEKPYAGVDRGMPRFRKGGYSSQEYPHATFAAMITRLDVYVGQIVEELKRLGVYDNTIIMFASDNGPHMEGGADPDFFDSNGPWRGYKRDLYEGGIRVPMILQWPGHIEAGRETDFVCSFWDMMPTFRTILDPKYKADGMDGINILPTLEGKKGQKEHEFLYFEFAERNGQASRIGPWKLIRQGINTPADHYELYNLDEDPSETTDIISEYPEKAGELKAIMEREHVANHDFPLFNGE